MKVLMLMGAAALVASLSMLAAPGAGAMPADRGGEPALIQPAAYGDMPTSGARHRGGRKRGPTAKDPEPTVPDLHGATREDADKQYRKKYGF